MVQRTLLGTSVSLLLVSTILYAPTGASPDERVVFDALITSFDGHQVPVTVYVANDSATAPTLLWGHGWSGNRGSSAGAAAFFNEHGYNVVAIDFRGHGEARSTSIARVHDVDYEIKDVTAVIDWIGGQDWAALDGPDDPVLGALGGSYGGGYQLLTAAFDDRLDAIAPEITWNDLTRSLAPNGAIRSDWVHILYAGAKAAANLDPDIDAAYREAMVMNSLPDGTGFSGVDLLSRFTASSPATYTSEIDIPTLLIQGVPDTLFNLNEAVANYKQIKAARGGNDDVFLLTHLSGHLINTRGTLGVIPGANSIPVGLQPPSGGSPCGDVSGTILAFYDHYLQGKGTFTADHVQMALDEGSCLRAADWPPTPSQTVGVGASVALSAAAGGRVLLPVLDPVFDEARTVAGVPVLSGTATGVVSDAIVYFSLVALGPDCKSDPTVLPWAHCARVVDAQVMPMRFGSDGAFALELGGVATAIPAGASLWLSVETWNEQYATNAGRVPDGAVLSGLALDLPLA